MVKKLKVKKILSHATFLIMLEDTRSFLFAC